jgi:hypothetical protein
MLMKIDQSLHVQPIAHRIDLDWRRGGRCEVGCCCWTWGTPELKTTWCSSTKGYHCCLDGYFLRVGLGMIWGLRNIAVRSMNESYSFTAGSKYKTNHTIEHLWVKIMTVLENISWTNFSWIFTMEPQIMLPLSAHINTLCDWPQSFWEISPQHLITNIPYLSWKLVSKHILKQLHD